MEGLAPEQSALTAPQLAAFTDTDGVIIGDPTTYRGIVWMPPSDGSYSLRILARFYSKDLTGTNDVSYWTAEFPEALVIAAKWFLEGMLKNSDGMKSLQEILTPILGGLDKDMADEESCDVSQMEG